MNPVSRIKGPTSVPETPQSPQKTQENSVEQAPVLTGQERRRIKHQEVFLNNYAELGGICPAARAAGIDRSCHYDWMARDKGYVQRFQELKETKVQRANDTAYRLGVVGVLVPKTVAGAREEVREYEPKVLIRWLETHDPKWRQDKIVELRMEDWDGDIDRLTPEAQEKLLEKLTTRLAALQAPTPTMPPAIQAAAEEIVGDDHQGFGDGSASSEANGAGLRRNAPQRDIDLTRTGTAVWGREPIRSSDAGNAQHERQRHSACASGRHRWQREAAPAQNKS